MGNCTGASSCKRFKECLKNHDLNKLWGYFGEEGDPNMWGETREKRFYRGFMNLKDEYDVKNAKYYGSFNKTYSIAHSLWHCINESPEFAKWLGVLCGLLQKQLDHRDDPAVDARIVKALKTAYESLSDDEKRSMATGGYNADRMKAFLLGAAHSIEITDDGTRLGDALLSMRESIISQWGKKEPGCKFSETDRENLDYRILAMLDASKTGKKYLRYLGERLLKETDAWRIECIVQLTEDYLKNNCTSGGK